MHIKPKASQSNSSDYYEDDDSEFLEALNNAVLPGDVPPEPENPGPDEKNNSQHSTTSEELEPPPATQPSLKRSRSYFRQEQPDEEEDKVDIKDDTYGASTFGGFGDYMRRKRAKLQVQNAEISQTDEPKDGDRPSQIFRGLSIYINGYTRPSVQELRQLIVQHGGIFQPYLDRKALVTHILTCSLTPAKIREFKNMKVVRPEWLVESAEQGILLPWKSYIYVHNERIEPSQGAKGKQKGLFDDATSDTQASVSVSSKPVQQSSTSTTTLKPPIPPFILPKKPAPAPDPLYTTDPITRADAARVPGYAADKSNPHAQRAMANPEWRKAHTSVSSGFIEGYYKNSRLHHLSTWKSELKDLVHLAQERAESASISGHTGKVASEAQLEGNCEGGVSMRGKALVIRSPASKWKGKGKAADGEERVIMHCDFDCFFVSAGLVSRPELKGMPVIVCHSQGATGGASSTSEIASSSYEARKFGIKNGMSLQQARQLCPQIITIPYEFERYKEFSLLFYTVLMKHADDLQAVSVDEALIDVTNTVNELRTQAQSRGSTQDPAKDFAEMIRAEVKKATTCEISIGISHNILLARLATRRAKPGGSYHLTPPEIPTFLAPLDISDLHGFGWSTKKKAQEKLGTTSLDELTKKSKGVLVDALGKGTGETLYNALRGVDDKKLESDKPRKSVSCEINYGIRFENNEQAEAFVRQMATEVKKRLEVIDMVGRSITLKIMKRDPTAPVEPPKFLGHGACDLFNKQSPLIGPGGRATSDEQIIGDHAWRLLKSFSFDPKELRGIGIQVQKLESSSAATTAPPGQAVLAFKAKSAVGTSRDIVPPPEIRVQPPSHDAVATTSDPAKPSNETFDLPSFSQVDKSVLAALPRDIREELENEYKRRSTSPFTSAAAGAGLASRPGSRATSMAPPPVPANRRSTTPNIFPAKPAGRMTNLQRIAQQLAPRSRSGLSPNKSALYAWARKPQKPKQVNISSHKLRELKLDPEVFFALPIKLQREQLTMARIIQQKGFLPEPPKERKVLKPKKFVLPADFVPYIAPKPKARHPTPPFLRQQGKAKGEKLYFTETDDVQRVVESWVETYCKWTPKDKDVDFLQKYIVQCVDRARATDVGVERAIAVMQWWRILLRRLFAASEIIDEEDEEDMALSQRNLIGEAWWAAFHRVKEDMDVISRKRFGGVLSLN